MTSTTEIGNTRPSAAFPESVARIHEVCFYSLTSSVWDDASVAAGDVSSTLDYADVAPTQSTQIFEHPCMPLTKIMSSGSFYYALDSQWDLSSRLSHRLTKEPGDGTSFDERFVWNEYIARSLLDFRERLSQRERDELDQCHFIVRRWLDSLTLSNCVRFLLYKDTSVSTQWPFQCRQRMENPQSQPSV